jgi:multiple sugar transport system permease protein
MPQTLANRPRQSLWPYLLLAPALLIVAAVVLVPVVNAIGMSFQNYDLRRPQEIGFIGLKNYTDMAADPLARMALVRTLAWVVFGVGLQFVFGFALALLLNRQFPLRGVVRSVSLIPWVTPGVLIALMWRWSYDGNYGVLNDVLLKLHLIQDKIPILAQTTTAFPAAIVTIVWQGIPFFALMLLAGLQGIPGELYESAEIDGASAPQRFWFITLPSLRNTIFVTTMLRVIWVANSVDIIANLTEGGPAYSSQTLSVYIFNKGNSLNLGYASAMAIVLALLLSAVAIPYLRSLFKTD